MRTVDINCDLGESFGNWKMGQDELVIPEITSANVACGFHASDPVTMIETARRCHAHSIAVGAHPGLPDLLGFGRRPMVVNREDVYAYVVYQAGALQGVLATLDDTLHHIKPHGAMYSILRTEEELAAAAAQAIMDFNPSVMVYWPAPVSAALPVAARERGIRVIGEIYPDLEYASDGSLLLQRAKHETDVDKAYRQVRLWLEEGVVQARDGTRIEMEAESVCVHGDGPNALEVVRAVRCAITDAGCQVAEPPAEAPVPESAPPLG